MGVVRVRNYKQAAMLAKQLKGYVDFDEEGTYIVSRLHGIPDIYPVVITEEVKNNG